ncbi:MAG: 4Fe-4S dicluster domain-containing protein, partial [Helicobacteraceae bacterium]|nr:4Fe-4S dicluster domain-containing protein [Helicobacteraceae bacterium]
VCPINLIADLAALTRRLTGVNSLSQPVNLPRSTRYYAAVLALILSFVLGVAVFDAISPIGLFTRALYFGALLGFCGAAAIFLWDLFVQRNGWCGHICPLGAFYSLVGKFSPLKIIFKRSLCTDCYECKKICPEQQVLSAVSKDNSDAAIVISAIECMKCGRCVEVCEGGALGFALTLKTKESK